MLPSDLIRPRTIIGMSAVLLPLLDSGAFDWSSFDAHVARTAAAGLTPAVNMDTGYAHLLDAATKTHVLDRTAAIVGAEFVAGAFDVGEAHDVRRRGATPVMVPNERMSREVIAVYREVAEVVDRFIGFELSPAFHPSGWIWDLATYKEVLHIEQCIGAKHSSLHREPEWERLRLRDQERPDFLVLTGNDLAIDMVVYGSDYLLGLSTFAPDLFAERDRLWADGDAQFYELNDALQHLGNVAFRPPVPAYRHSAALFLRLRGWITTDATPANVPRRDAGELELLRDCGARLGLW
ncbi:MAG TPA: dihydrodipicolinate synthase family protein [Acidimicrobiales bacterium]|nr:dihydrodipicolinate synthase family protein [Acidimicrobiales bacterium]